MNSPDGTRQWGLFGAAGLLLRAPRSGGGAVVLMQHRAPWSHQGGTWALPGGARDSHETSAVAAVREAHEEAGIDPEAVRVRGSRVTATAPSGWTYTTVIADIAEPVATTANPESAALAWVPEEQVDARPLHPGFAAAWPLLRAEAARLALDGLGDTTDATRIAETLPRTVDLADQGFFWLHGNGSSGREARIAGASPGLGDSTDNVLYITVEQLLF